MCQSASGNGQEDATTPNGYNIRWTYMMKMRSIMMIRAEKWDEEYCRIVVVVANVVLVLCLTETDTCCLCVCVCVCVWWDGMNTSVWSKGYILATTVFIIIFSNNFHKNEKRVNKMKMNEKESLLLSQCMDSLIFFWFLIDLTLTMKIASNGWMCPFVPRRRLSPIHIYDMTIWG